VFSSAISFAISFLSAISFSFVILVTRGKGFFVSPIDADIGDVRAHAVEIHPGVTKIVVMALGATGRWVARERRMVGEER
jgi:hypothetical protein